MQDTLRSQRVCSMLSRIAGIAQERPGTALTALNQYLTVDLLWEAYRRTRKGGATGVDGQTASEYAENLEANLQSLLDRAKSGTYRAPPVRRVYIPKGRGDELRPLGIPTFEDKILQRGVAMILEAVYEGEFHPNSYGFRPRRDAHDALAYIWECLRRGGGWVVDADIRRFFDSVDRKHLRAVLERRVRDGVLVRLIMKWLHAGVMEEGQLEYPDLGTPQGGVISPMLANIFLNEVLDTWWESEVKPRLQAPAHLIRFADDFLLVFQREEDARRVLEVLPKRFAKYGLTLHPTKTRLVRFERPPDGGEPPADTGTFDFLGFTHYWGKSRAGHWIVCRKTARNRLGRAVRAVWDWCRRHRHDPIRVQRLELNRKLRGHYNYYGCRGNYRSLNHYHEVVVRVWRYWLNRRSGRRHLNMERFVRLLKTYPLASPRLRAAKLHT
jgi:RNA-directed DNA polymerase